MRRLPYCSLLRRVHAAHYENKSGIDAENQMSGIARIVSNAGVSPASALIDAVGMGALTALIVLGFGLG